MISLEPKHLGRYRDIARLLLRHGRGIGLERDGTERLLAAAGWEELEDRHAPGDPEALARDLEAMGPTFVKLGQLLSTRPDLLPRPYTEALSRLQDDVEPFAADDVERIVESELGVRLSRAFEEFDPLPVAAASLAQVHRALLRSGTPVAVKVQRPDIRPRILEDLEALEGIAGALERHTEAGRRFAPRQIVERFRTTLLRELDFRSEADHLRSLGRHLDSYDRIVVPRPVEDYTTSRVLTMEWVEGRKVSELGGLARVEMQVDAEELAADLIRAYLDQVLVHGFFHADPHPGNVFLTSDGRLALLDLGMIERVDPVLRRRLLRLVLAVADGRGREAAEIGVELGRPLPEADREGFKREVADLADQLRDTPAGRLQVGLVLMEVARASARHGIRPAAELSVLGKTLLHLDEVARILAPDFRPDPVIRRHADSLMRRQMREQLSPENLVSTALEVNELVTTLPGRLNAVLGALAENRFRIRLDAVDEPRLSRNLLRVANRIALGLVLAALIVGAALLMRVETSFTILGYPGLAMLLFLLAAGCGFALVTTILIQDGGHRRGG